MNIEEQIAYIVLHPDALIGTKIKHLKHLLKNMKSDSADELMEDTELIKMYIAELEKQRKD